MSYRLEIGFKILLVSVSLLYSALAISCSCGSRSGEFFKDVSEASLSATSILVAKVESVRLSQVDSPLKIETTHFSEIESWKGDHGKQVYTRIITECCVCGFSFAEGKIYLLYLYGPDDLGYYSTSICSRTKLFDGSEEEVKILNSIFPISD